MLFNFKHYNVFFRMLQFHCVLYFVKICTSLFYLITMHEIYHISIEEWYTTLNNILNLLCVTFFYLKCFLRKGRDVICPYDSE